jgi:uncharacterized protein (DUF302 family)
MSDLISFVSPHDHAVTLQRIEREVQRRGAGVYARVDHAANAESAGLSMPPTTILTFGNPRGGTPVMLAAPESAYDLPLRVMVRTAGDEVLVEFRPPARLGEAYGVDAAALAPLRVIDEIVAAAVAP